MKKLLADGFTTPPPTPTRSSRVLVCPSGAEVSTSTLRYLSACLRTNLGERGTRWRRLPAGWQTLLVLAHLRSGHAYAGSQPGIGIDTTTVYRYITGDVEALASRAPTSPKW